MTLKNHWRSQWHRFRLTREVLLLTLAVYLAGAAVVLAALALLLCLHRSRV
jgi:hypothetical protein